MCKRVYSVPWKGPKAHQSRYRWRSPTSDGVCVSMCVCAYVCCCRLTMHLRGPHCVTSSNPLDVVGKEKQGRNTRSARLKVEKPSSYEIGQTAPFLTKEQHGRKTVLAQDRSYNS